MKMKTFSISSLRIEFNLLAVQTILYAYEQKETMRRSSPLTFWKNIDTTEMKIFYGLLLHLGSCIFYAKCNFGVKPLSILFDLHFAALVSNAKLYIIRPMLNHFNKTMRETYVPDRSLYIGCIHGTL